MSVINTYFILMAAALGTILFLVNPVTRLNKWLRGKKESQLKNEFREMVNQGQQAKILGIGCGLLSFMVLLAIFDFTVLPLAVVSAIKAEVGFQPAGYFALSLVFYSWYGWVKLIYFKPKPIELMTQATDEKGNKIKAVIIEEDKEFETTHPLWLAVRRVVLNLDTAYLWYVFLTVILQG